MGWWKNPYEDIDVDDVEFHCPHCDDEDAVGYGWAGPGGMTLTCVKCEKETEIDRER